MKESPISRLRWSEIHSAEQVRQVLEEYRHVEVQLPADYHHVLFSRLQPAAEMAGQEQLDISGGAELLAAVASIRGLRGVTLLEAVVDITGAHVRVISPVPLIVLRLDSGSPLRK